MKTGNILSAYKFIEEKEIELLCTSTGINVNLNDIYLFDIGMGPGSGYGQYTLTVIVDINGEKHAFYQHSTDSMLYDSLKSAEYDSEDWQAIILSIFQSVMEAEANEDKLRDIEEAIEEDE